MQPASHQLEAGHGASWPASRAPAAHPGRMSWHLVMDPVLLTPRQAGRLLDGLMDLEDAVEALEAAEHRAQAAGHPAFSRKALRRWEAMSHELRDLRTIVLDAAVRNPGPVRPPR